MNRLTCLEVSTVLAILCLRGQTAFSQTEDSSASGSFRFGLSAGITGFSLGDLRNFTADLVSEYHNSGVQVELQREYPPNILAGAEYLYVGLESWALGLSGSYTWTNAYGLYADYSGTLDLDSKVQVICGYLVVQYTFLAGSTFQGFLDVRGGISSVSLRIEETIDASEYAGVRASSVVTGQEIGFGGEAAVGLRYPFGALALTGRVGYRYSNISSVKVDVSSSGQSLSTGTLKFDINTSGFVGLLTLELSL